MNIINRCLVHCPVIHSHFLFPSQSSRGIRRSTFLNAFQTVLCLPLTCHPRRSASGISNFAICDNITITPRTYTLFARLYINHGRAFLKPESNNTTQRIPSVECISLSSIYNLGKGLFISREALIVIDRPPRVGRWRRQTPPVASAISSRRLTASSERTPRERRITAYPPSGTFLQNA